MKFFGLEKLFTRGNGIQVRSKPSYTVKDVYKTNHTLIFPDALVKVIEEEAANEESTVRESRWDAIDGVVSPLCTRYSMRGSIHDDGGFINGQRGELRFIMDKGPNGSQKFVYGFSICGVKYNSPEHQRLVNFAVDYINGLVDLYQEKPWKK